MTIFRPILAATAMLVLSMNVAVHAEEHQAPLGDSVISITPGQQGDIYLTYGKTTTISLKGGTVQKIEGGSSDIVLIKPGEDFKTVLIEPVVQSGESNMIVQMNNKLYEFILHIVEDPNVRTAVTAKMADAEEWAPPHQVPAMRPDRIDVVSLMDRIEEIEMNPDYLSSHTDVVFFKVNRRWTWNNSGVVHRHTTYFRNMDLLVLKFELHNRTKGILYLHAKQYQLRIGNTPVPVTVSTQLSKTLYPGQIDHVFLFIQGYGISPSAKFDLRLPPESEAIRKLLRN